MFALHLSTMWEVGHTGSACKEVRATVNRETLSLQKIGDPNLTMITVVYTYSYTHTHTHTNVTLALVTLCTMRRKIKNNLPVFQAGCAAP